jgi:hypothetical protein
MKFQVIFKVKLIGREKSKNSSPLMSKELEEKFKILNETMNKEIETIKKEKEIWENQKELIQKISFLEEDVIQLNVGGNLFTTYHQTLCKKIKGEENMLTAMFSGRFELKKDSEGRYFIDRDGRHFAYILNYLRDEGNEEEIILPEDPLILRELKKEFNYYQISWPEKIYYFGIEGGLISKEQWKKLSEWCNYDGKWKLIYSGTKDGFKTSTFHSKCDNQGPTITAIQASNGYIFGGYSPAAWKSIGNYHPKDTKSFLFSFLNANGTQMVKMENNGPHGNYSIYDNASYGSTWGGGHVIDS